MTSQTRLGDLLDEVKVRVGTNWSDYTVYGATVNGIAPPKEPPGKSPEKYKQGKRTMHDSLFLQHRIDKSLSS